jgi:hypothetical protein
MLILKFHRLAGPFLSIVRRYRTGFVTYLYVDECITSMRETDFTKVAVKD